MKTRKFDVFTGTVTTKHGMGAKEEYYKHPEARYHYGSFDTLEEARKCFESIPLEARKVSCGYEQDFKELEENEYEYDEDGDLISVEDIALIDDKWEEFEYCHKTYIDGFDSILGSNNISEEEAKKLLGDKFYTFSDTYREDSVTIRTYVNEKGEECEEVIERC